MRPLPEESIFSTLSPCYSWPISSDVPLGAEMMIIDLAQSCRSLFIVWQILMRSSQVMQWYSRISSLSRNYLRIWLFNSCIFESKVFSSQFIRSSLVFSSTISLQTYGSSLPPIHLIVFFCIFSTYLIPYNTLVMSQMRRFCTLSKSTATLRSMVMFSLFLMRSINFLVSTDKLLSCLPLPLSLLPLLLALSSSSSQSSLMSYYNFGVGFLLIRLPILVEYYLRIKMIISRSITLKNSQKIQQGKGRIDGDGQRVGLQTDKQNRKRSKYA